MGNDIFGIFDSCEKYGFSGERGTGMASFDRRYAWLADSEMRRANANMRDLYAEQILWAQPTTLGPNQLAWCRENLRGFAMEGRA